MPAKRLPMALGAFIAAAAGAVKRGGTSMRCGLPGLPGDRLRTELASYRPSLGEGPFPSVGIASEVGSRPRSQCA